MKKFGIIIFTFCGLLMLAAFPVFGQNDKSVREIQINKKPITDLAQFVLAKIENDKVDLSQPFKVILEGSLVKKIENDREIVVLDQNKAKWLVIEKEEAGNTQVAEIAKTAVEAISDSGFFTYFYNFGIKDLKITFYQTADKFAVNLESEMETLERARTTASGFNGLFQMAKFAVKGEDEKTLLSGFQTPTTNDKTLFLNFELPKNTVHEIINRNLTNYKNRKLSEQK
jgi:hypothetical protein